MKHAHTVWCRNPAENSIVVQVEAAAVAGLIGHGEKTMNVRIAAA